MDNLKSMKGNVKGITLIALVITIIVLIILAGVSVSLLLVYKMSFSLVFNKQKERGRDVFQTNCCTFAAKKEKGE